MTKTTNNPLLLAEIIGWLKCKREYTEPQYLGYILFLRRTIKRENWTADHRKKKQLISCLINFRNEPLSKLETGTIGIYIKAVEGITLQYTPLPQASTA